MSLSLRLAAITKHDTLRAFRIRDFRLLWSGAFLSFMGTWIQSVAQGWLVYDLTRDESKLAWVSFCGMIPMALLGPIAGSFVDTWNRRRILVVSQLIYGVNALFLATVVHYHLVSYWLIISVALVNGVVNCFETPTRQSLVGSIVPPEDIPAAIPVNAMTFNLSRVIGPAVGGVLLAWVGAQLCYFLNGLSYLALVFAVLGIRADISAKSARTEPIRDLVMEGLKYTFRDVRLRTLFFMECTTSMFGLSYMALMPAIAKTMLGLDKRGLGMAMTSIGVGTMSGLLLLMVLSARPIKGLLVRVTMTTFSLSLLALSLSRTPFLAFPLLALTGGSAVMQFNLTNTMFQMIAPDHLRGRVITMHIWALSGAGPLLLPFFGWLARQAGLPIALQVAGLVVFGGALMSWIHRDRLAHVDD